MGYLSTVFVEALMLLAVGMGFVFAFLSLLIIAINLLAKFSAHFPDEIPHSKNISNEATVPDVVSSKVVAAISVAIAQYRKEQKPKE
ncbi:OadG family protein [Thalassotalea aquiviva]|uniref:OadG family protein n=1 Tax=Thalassotalea aquiviva TaxID=3242415 RepID=UPI00352AF498